MRYFAKWKQLEMIFGLAVGLFVLLYCVFVGQWVGVACSLFIIDIFYTGLKDVEDEYYQYLFDEEE